MTRQDLINAIDARYGSEVGHSVMKQQYDNLVAFIKYVMSDHTVNVAGALLNQTGSFDEFERRGVYENVLMLKNPKYVAVYDSMCFGFDLWLQFFHTNYCHICKNYDGSNVIAQPAYSTNVMIDSVRETEACTDRMLVTIYGLNLLATLADFRYDKELLLTDDVSWLSLFDQFIEANIANVNLTRVDYKFSEWIKECFSVKYLDSLPVSNNSAALLELSAGSVLFTVDNCSISLIAAYNGRYRVLTFTFPDAYSAIRESLTCSQYECFIGNALQALCVLTDIHGDRYTMTACYRTLDNIDVPYKHFTSDKLYEVVEYFVKEFKSNMSDAEKLKRICSMTY